MFRLIGEKIGHEAVEELKKSDRFRWIIDSAALDGMEAAWRDAPASIEKDRLRAMAWIAARRESLGPCPEEEGADQIQIFNAIVLALCLLGMVALIAFWVP